MFVVWVVEAEKGRHLLKILFSRLFKKRRGCCYIIEEEIDWFHSSRNLEGCLAAITNPRTMSLRSAGPVIHKWGLEVCWPLSLLTLCGPGSVEEVSRRKEGSPEQAGQCWGSHLGAGAVQPGSAPGHRKKRGWRMMELSFCTRLGELGQPK